MISNNISLDPVGVSHPLCGTPSRRLRVNNRVSLRKSSCFYTSRYYDVSTDVRYCRLVFSRYPPLTVVSDRRFARGFAHKEVSCSCAATWTFSSTRQLLQHLSLPSQTPPPHPPTLPEKHARAPRDKEVQLLRMKRSRPSLMPFFWHFMPVRTVPSLLRRA
jgi:hypothetical protein